MKCAAMTKQGDPCTRDVHSGCTIEVGRYTYHLCQQHYTMREQGKALDYNPNRRHVTPAGRVLDTLRREEQTIMARMGQAQATEGDSAVARALRGELPQGVYRNNREETDMPTEEDISDWTNPIDMGYRVMGTGSRRIQTMSKEDKAKIMAILRKHLHRLVRDHGDDLVIITGMAEGFDKALAVAALRMGIAVYACVPNKGYGLYYWANHSLTGENKMAEFNEILEACSHVEYTTDHLGVPDHQLYYRGRHMNFVRNDRMVELADEALVWDPSTRGTADAFRSIRAKGIPFAILNTEM